MATKDFQVRFKSGPNEPTVLLNTFKNATRISAYKCEYLSPDLSDCSRCQFLKAFRGYNCVWCGKTNGCVESEKCLTQEICPPPEITKIDPRDGPVGGGTVVRLEGKNLGMSISDVQMVSVAGRKCSNIQFVDQSIRCTTGNVNDTVKGDVMVKVSGIWSVKTVQFAYKNPNITNISPASVIQSGGARIWITGQDINIGNRNYKLILYKSGWWRGTFSSRCAVDLNVSVNGSIICVPGKSRFRGKHRVLVVFDKKTRKYYGEYLEIFPDPIIYGTIPPARDLKSIKSGGLAFYVTWQGYIDVIQNIFTSLSESSLEGQNCSRNNSGLLKCEFPTMQEHILGHRKKRDITFRTIAIHMDGFKHVISREVIYVSDPIFYPLNDNQSYKYDPTSGNRVITIKGSNMNTVASLQDYSVYVGSMECSVLQLHKDSLTFLPPLKEPDTLLQEERPYIRVRVGNINTIVGYLQYRTSKPVTPNFSGIVYIVLASGAVFLFFATCGSVVLISFCRRKKQSIGRTSSNEQGIPLKNVQRFTGSGMLNRKVSGNVTRTFESNVNENIEFLLQNNGLLISNQSLEIKREIGKGNFGVVFEGTLANLDDNSHIKVAIKTLHQNNLNQIDVDNFLDEAIRMHEFNHPNVLTLIGICFSMDDTPWIVLPFMKHGDLLGYLRDDKNILTRQNLMEYGIDISKGMEYLSSQKIVHRDLAARNCMVDESFRIVVADFGLSRDIYEKNYYSSSNKKTKLPVKWMSPESLEKGIYSSKSDVWSFGVILWELVTRGSKPYPEVDCWDMLDYIKDGRRLQQPTECPDDLCTIMELCWNLDPDQRPTFSDLIISLRQIVSPSDGYTELNSDYEGLHHTDAENDNQFGYDELKKI